MNLTLAKDLLVLSFKAPDQALYRAEGLIETPRSRWMLLLLITVLTSLLSSSLLFLLPKDDPQINDIIAQMVAYRAPVIFAALQFGRAVLGIYAIAFIGKAAGGRGEVDHIALGLALVQIAALCLVILVTICLILLPVIAELALVAILIWGIWASVMVINASHEFNNKIKAFLVLLGAGAVTLGIWLVVMSLFGEPIMSELSNV